MKNLMVAIMVVLLSVSGQADAKSFKEKFQEKKTLVQEKAKVGKGKIERILRINKSNWK
jgi:hypothetical protein